MTFIRSIAAALLLAAALGACTPDDAQAPPTTEPATTEPATEPANGEPGDATPVAGTLPEVRYYQISDG